VVSSNLNNIIYNVSGNLNTTIGSVSGDLNASIIGVRDYVEQNYITSSELLDKNNQINAKYLPPISITSVQTVELSAVLEAAKVDYKDNPNLYLNNYFAEQPLQEGDVVIVVATSGSVSQLEMNAKVLGPWIVSAPKIDIADDGVYGDGLSGSLSFTKLIFPTTDVNSVNNIVPDYTGNISINLSNLADYGTNALSALYQVAFDKDTKRLGSYLYDPTNDKDSKQYYATIDEVNYVSGNVDTISSTVNAVSESLNTTIGNVNTVSGNLDNIYTILTPGAFYTDSITFDSKSGGTVSSAILKEKVDVNVTFNENLEHNFGLELKEYQYSFNIKSDSEIVAIYSVSNGRQENFYPDVMIEANKCTISVFVMNATELP
jgi:flagellar basal body rod protein FlgC